MAKWSLTANAPLRKHRTHSIAFKRQVVQEYLAGETLHGLARRHDLSRTLIRIWVDKYEAGAFDEDAEAASMIQEVRGPDRGPRAPGRQAGPGARVPKGGSEARTTAENAPMSVITGPKVSPSLKDAG